MLARSSSAPPNFLGGVEPKSADEDRRTLEATLLLVAEQVVGPGDRVAHRPLPVRQVAIAAGQDRQPILQSGEERLWREHADPRRGQLDGQRQPVEASADRGDRRGVFL